MALQLKEEDKVYLLTKNLKTRKKSKKLDYIKVGPFSIKVKKKPVFYKLELPKDAKVYLIFYVLLLELADSKISIQDMFYYQVQEDNKFKVKKILD